MVPKGMAESRNNMFYKIFLLTSLVCLLPALLNLLGFNFASQSIALDAGKVAADGIVIDDVFHALTGSTHHALLEWSAVITAFLTVLLSFAHFGISKDVTTPIIGVAMFFSGMMDAFHTLAAMRLIEASASNTDLIPFTWALSRTFNAAIMMIGVIICLRLDLTKTKAPLKKVFIISAVFGIAAYILIHLAATNTHLPQTQYPNAFITRPFDVLPLLLFMIVLPLFIRLYRKNPNFLTASIILSVIPASILEVHMAFGSSKLFDNHFNIAHFLKIVEYFIPFIGLSLEYIRSHNLLELAEQKLKATNKRLQERTAEAQASSAHMQAILETAADAIITINMHGDIQSFNHAAEKIFGYEEEEVFNKNIKILMPSPYDKGDDDYLSDYMTSGKANTIGMTREVLALRKNKETFPIELSISEIKTKGGMRFFTGFIRDISERKFFEETLIQYAQDLEGKSLELEISRQKAEAANQAKSEFLANMSHEIRTPMNGIIGTTSLIAETKLSKKQKNYIATIRDSSESLLQLINDILDFSKIEAGKLDMEVMPFDLQVLMEEVRSVMFVNVKNGIDFEIDWHTDTPRYVQADPGRIRQILYNLIGNAIKFTEEGYIKINVQSAGEEGGNHRFMVSVEDTGIGIPKNKLNHIFEKFNQAEETTTRRFGGTGLGLAICDQLVHMMDGKIHAESTEGKGSKFWFTMCLPLSNVEDVEEVLNHHDMEAFENLKFDDVQILIAEDNRTNMMIATEILEQYGCHITPAGNGLEAIERASKQDFDLIFMDCRMPEMDGYEATGCIREYESKKGLPAIPIIALTANAMKGDRDACLAAGMDDYISKPMKQTELAAMLVKWLPAEKLKAS